MKVICTWSNGILSDLEKGKIYTIGSERFKNTPCKYLLEVRVSVFMRDLTCKNAHDSGKVFARFEPASKAMRVLYGLKELEK